MRKLVQIDADLPIEFPQRKFTEDQLFKIEKFVQLLEKWNKKINLTSLQDSREIFAKHVLDSLGPLLFDDFPIEGRIADIGSGAGLPGAMISIAFPQAEVISIEKNSKKIGFQETAKASLKLGNFKPLRTRVEDIISEGRNGFDYLISRAFSSLDALISLGADLVKPGGTMILWKGLKWREEWEAAGPKKELFLLEESRRYDFPKYATGGFLIRLKRRS